MLVFDTSGSMLATDVTPSRLAAAQSAGNAFVESVPDEFRIGVVGFGSAAQQLSEPTTDHARVKATISSLQVAGATAMGDALKLAINSARVPIPDGLGGERRLPAAIVLLGDGSSTRGEDPIDVVQQTKKYKIPVYTVALGSQNGTLTHTDPKTGAVNTERVPPDLLTLQDIARDTGGQFFATADARQAGRRLPQPRHAADQDQGEAAGDVGLRGRRDRAAARRRRASAWRAAGDSHERAPAPGAADAGAHAGQARSRARPAAGPALARPRGDEADRVAGAG